MQFAPLPGFVIAAQLAVAGADRCSEAAGEDGRFVFFLRGAHVIPERAVLTPEQVIGLGRVGQLAIGDKGPPRRAAFRAQFIEEDLPGAFLQEQFVDGRIGGGRAELAVERHQAAVGFVCLGAIGRRQGVHGLFEWLGHTRRFEHFLQLGSEGGGLVVLHGDQAAAVVFACAGQFGQALAALRSGPGIGQLHAVAMGDDPLIGGAEPALGRVLVVRVQHRVGITVPVISTFPTRRGQQAFAFAAVRIAAGDLPANVAGIGKHQVQGNGANFAAGVRRFFDVLRTGQVKEGVQALVVGKAWRLQGQAETAALGQALGTVEQGTVAGFEHGFANRPLAFDEIGFVAHDRRLPLPGVFVGKPVALALDLLQEQVLVVAHHGRHAPRHLAVETSKHHRQTRDGHAGCLILRRANLHVTEQRRHAQRAMTVTGQQALAAAAALWGDGPVVRRSGAQQVQVRQLARGFAEFGQPRYLPVELEALQFFAFGDRQFFVGSRRRQPCKFVGGNGLGQYQRGNFFRQVGRLAEVQEAENQRRILRLPVLRLVAGGCQIRRQFVAVAEQVGVDPARIDFEETLEAW
ncbi:hypothetical protein D9M73_126780 [compost metagenome]